MNTRNQDHQQQQEQQPALASSKAWVGQAREQLGSYGYGLADEDEGGHRCVVGRNGQVLGVCVEYRARGGRFSTYAHSSGKVLWTGPNLGSFCRDFWLATKVGGA